jgi:ABC-type polysaccharide/polyol phosphate export permease
MSRAEIVQQLGDTRRHRRSAKGYCWAILAGLVLAIICTVVKAATGHSIAGLLVTVMILAGVFSLVWDFATRERR